jgi:GNAT superfamily N-acetyltransferase
VRQALPQDRAAYLVFDAAPQVYAGAAGSARRGREILGYLWPQRGHSASFEHAIVAEVDGILAGVLIAFPARRRYRLHLALLRRGLTYTSPLRWPLLAVGLTFLIAATPRPPRDAYYIATIAVAPFARRRDVASTLGRHAEMAAARHRMPLVAAHTGARHLPARRALERYGLRPVKRRSWGFVLYVKGVAPTR